MIRFPTSSTNQAEDRDNPYASQSRTLDLFDGGASSLPPSWQVWVHSKVNQFWLTLLAINLGAFVTLSAAGFTLSLLESDGASVEDLSFIWVIGVLVLIEIFLVRYIRAHLKAIRSQQLIDLATAIEEQRSFWRNSALAVIFLIGVLAATFLLV